MSLSLKLLPKDSALWKWVQALEITEVPLGYQIFSGMSAAGALLRRNVWIDQVEWQVYPNLSVMFVGPSGIGKDVAIRAASRVIGRIAPELDIGGKTMEAIQEQILCAGDPACAFIAAPEMTAFFGGRDYQKGMLQELTDLLSTGDSVNVSLKSAPGVKRVIRRPTITMQAGSTAEWLHKAMPDGALEGGFFPRFVIMCEDYGRKQVPWVKYSISKKEREAALQAKEDFISTLAEISTYYAAHPQEIVPDRDAIDYYANWYYNRFNKFGPAVRAYANRSRDQVLRMAMLSAVLRGHRFVDGDDCAWAGYLMEFVAETIEAAVLPATQEVQIGDAVRRLLPATQQELLKALVKKHPRKQIEEALRTLIDMGVVEFVPANRQWRLKE